MSTTNAAAIERLEWLVEQYKMLLIEAQDENARLKKENWILRGRVKFMLEEIPN